MNSGDWWIDHPIKAFLLFAGTAVVVMLTGPGAAWLTSSLHWVSPDNVLAGFGMGIGGAQLGLIAGLIVVGRVNAIRSRR